MGLPGKLLGNDEVEVMHLRTHAKVLIGPVLVLLLLAVLLAAGLALMPSQLQPWGPWVVVAVVLLAFLALCVAPWLRWLTTTYTLTNRRIITRRGVLTRSGHDLPLMRINDVSYRRSLLDRLFGCGTLVLQTAAENPVVLPDLPDIERVHVRMTELLFGSAELDPGEGA